MIRASDIVYSYLLKIVETYQKNYRGNDKMSMEYMLNEIEIFIKRGINAEQKD